MGIPLLPRWLCLLQSEEWLCVDIREPCGRALQRGERKCAYSAEAKRVAALRGGADGTVSLDALRRVPS